MRRFASLFMAALLPLSLLTAGASASPPSPYLEAPELVSVRADALTQALDEGRISDAEYALHRARSLFRLGAVRAEFGEVKRADPHSATLILRDLALRLRSLSGEDRATGNAILARPTQGGTNDGYLEYTTAEAAPIDSPNFRLHYVASGDHASTLANATSVSAILEEVYTREITQMGWRAPKSDAPANPNGGNSLLDVYLGNVGADGIYGYCTVDPGQTTYDQYGYCVLDNDFSSAEFGTVVNGLNAARVTAAHEYNHAIHFAYDVTEDSWLLEATATWMEDQVYDDINDNYQYLPGSPLGRPETPADTFSDFTVSGPDQLYQYGTFIWMRYLSEKFDNNAVRQIWEQADAKTTGANSLYSLEAIDAMLAARGTQFSDAFADFGARNADASSFYEEGAGYEAKVMPVRSMSHTIAPATPVVATRTNADHLTSRYISFTPNGSVGATESLSIAVNMGTAPMQEARVVTLDAGSPMEVAEVPLVNGEGSINLPFGGKDELVLVLTNASNRMTCGGGVYSCQGRAVDDNRNMTYSAVTGTTPQDPGDPAEPPSDTTAPVMTGVKVKPNPVARGKTAKILFSIDEAAELKITILKAGRKVLAGTVTVDSAGKWFVEWKIGKRMATGKYVVKLKATDAAGNFSTKKTTAQII